VEAWGFRVGPVATTLRLEVHLGSEPVVLWSSTRIQLRPQNRTSVRERVHALVQRLSDVSLGAHGAVDRLEARKLGLGPGGRRRSRRRDRPRALRDRRERGPRRVHSQRSGLPDNRRKPNWDQAAFDFHAERGKHTTLSARACSSSRSSVATRSRNSLISVRNSKDFLPSSSPTTGATRLSITASKLACHQAFQPASDSTIWPGAGVRAPV